jgi:geranylgeranyl pyrophosphate synthase
MNNDAKDKGKKKLAERMDILLTKKGAEAYQKAKEIILNEKFECEIIREAILFFMQEWHEIKHPGLLSVACESVGGDPNSVNDVGAALVFLLGSAHIHDDIIDQSKSKEGKPTVYGKFGKDIALLVGDALLFEGLILLHKFCEKLPTHKKEIILNLIKSAFFEVGNGEANEVILKREGILSAERCLDNLRMRAAMAEAVMRIGAIIGNGNDEEIEILGHYGRILGLLAAIREEFIDIFEPEELMNRYRHEFLPLPILYALQNKQKRYKIMHLINKNRISADNVYTIADLVMNSEEVRKLKNDMKSLIESELISLKLLKRNVKVLRSLLNSMIEDL